VQHADYVALLRGGVPNPGGVWADFGSGQGAYTLALADLIGPGSTLYSIDNDAGALATQAKLMASQFPQVQLQQITADFIMPLQPALPPLDGLVMANALHLVPQHQKAAVVKLLKSYLKSDGRWLLVDYNVDFGNFWVPYPLSYTRWEALARECGFEHVRLVAKHPDNFLKESYLAECLTIQPPAPAATPAPAQTASPAQTAAPIVAGVPTVGAAPTPAPDTAPPKVEPTVRKRTVTTLRSSRPK
jgi:SAM-dependent methyltransferase